MTSRSILFRLGVVLVGLAALTVTAPADADIIHADDVIIEFSLCVGFDCVNGENFGFDTIRIKENNLRIHADDTSNSASFPLNDWRLVFNDTSNGGANKFSVEDSTAGLTPFTIEAGSPTNSLYVDSSKRVGFGTSTPVVDLHSVSGNTPTLRLEQNGSSGFTPQTWDVAGNEAGFFIRDATNGSTLPLRIRPGAPSSSIDIAAGGLVGIGTGSPETSLHVRTAEPQVLVEATGVAAGRTLAYLKNSGDVRFFWENTASGDIWQMSMLSTVLQMATPTGNGKFRVRKSGGLQALNGSTEIMALNSTGDLTVKSVTETSSREAKNGFESVDAVSVLEKVAGLPISKWSYKADSPSVRHLGPMAEDFHAAFGLGKTDKGITSVDTSGVALAAIQGLNQKLTEKDARISELEQRLLELEEMVQALAEH